MSIQFLCISCGSPIEVDDQWSHQLVECPYCHDTITAPAMSTYDPNRAVTGASAAHPVDGMGMEGGDHPYPMEVAPSRRGNRLAIVALILACLSLLGFVSSSILTYRTIEASGWADLPPEELAEKFQQPDQAMVLAPAAMAMLGSCGVWFGAMVCGLIAVIRPVGRGAAIAALLIVGMPPSLFMLIRLLVSGA